MKSKILIVFAVVIALWLTGCQKVDMEMRFGETRAATERENINNGASGALMAANEDYVAFVDIEGALIVYDKEKDEYRIVEKGYRKDNLQIHGNKLYFRRYDITPEGNVIYEYDLIKKRKRKVYDHYLFSLMHTSFILYDDTIFLMNGQRNLVRIDMEGNVLEEYGGAWDFTLFKEYLYYEDTSTKQVIKENIHNQTDRKVFGKFGSEIMEFYVHDDYVYFIMRSNMGYSTLLAREKDGVVEQLDKRLKYYTVFYDDMIVSGNSYYTLEGDYLGDYTGIYAEYMRPTVVGDDLYVFSEEPLDLPEVGEGWYKVEEKE
jgi:hypothetical protein